MASKVTPTRGALMRMIRTASLAQKGHDLLERKRQILMMELVKHIDDAKNLQREMASVFADAYKALERANISMGIDVVEDIAMAVPEEEDFIIRLKSIMGVEIPEIDPIAASLKPSYSFYGTSGSLDIAYSAFRRVLELISRLAAVETSVYRLAVQIKKTHKRVNALEKVAIPFYKSSIAYIENVLEEGEREDIVRMKKAKENLEKKK